ncbi:MAG: WXG100 family type VII secretion target [Kibdelosporangium sp.]
MPDGNIKVSFAAIQEAAGNIKTAFGKMEGELDTLKSQIAPLREAYQGEAKEKWDAVQNEWNTAQTELNTVLNSIGIAVAQAGDDYQATEKGVGNLWG